ncbi:hypothetical protein [Tessaracoccus sp. Y1736]
MADDWMGALGAGLSVAEEHLVHFLTLAQAGEVDLDTLARHSNEALGHIHDRDRLPGAPPHRRKFEDLVREYLRDG